MGPVNPLAASEYNELNERHEFLTAQLDDLEESRGELRKVIEALEEKIHELFVAAFDEVTQNYTEFFDVLFPGGKGSHRVNGARSSWYVGCGHQGSAAWQEGQPLAAALWW